MKLLDYLDEVSADYELTRHAPTFTAQQMAAEEHVHGMNIAKPVLVRADGVDYLCVLPGCCKIDFEALKSVLEAEHVELADEEYMANLFPDCQIGAEPAFGSFYGVPTIMDDRLEDDEFVVFQFGSHEKAIKMDLAEYKRIEQPRIHSFSYHIR